MSKGFGDRLARGSAKAAFAASEGVTEEKFATAVGDYDSATFLKNQEDEREAAYQRKQARIAAEQAEADQRRADTLAARDAEKLIEAEAEKDNEPESEFGSRYSNIKTPGVSGSDSGTPSAS